MDETIYAATVGRRPLPNADGERLAKYAVKLFPSQWKWLMKQGNASEWVRKQIDAARAKKRRSK